MAQISENTTDKGNSNSFENKQDNPELKNNMISEVDDTNKEAHAIYEQAKNKMSAVSTEGGYKELARQFESIEYYRDASILAKECYDKANERRLMLEQQAEIFRNESKKRAKTHRIKVITALTVCIIIALVAVWNFVIIPNNKYNKALDLMEAGKYTDAIVAFEALNGYKDSIEMINESKYNNARELMDSGNYEEAYEVLASLGSYNNADTLIIYDKNLHAEAIDVALEKKFSVGNYVTFGSYPQSFSYNTPIEWLVLARDENKALLISRYILDARNYHSRSSYSETVTWEKCMIRSWLNNDFLNVAFTDLEKTVIPTVNVPADPNAHFDTNPGNATQDKIFLLSSTEAKEYFTSINANRCQAYPTEYAIQNGCGKNSIFGTSWWLLRTPGWMIGTVSFVDEVGYVDESGFGVDGWNPVDGVRPALWIDLNSYAANYTTFEKIDQLFSESK